MRNGVVDSRAKVCCTYKDMYFVSHVKCLKSQGQLSNNGHVLSECRISGALGRTKLAYWYFEINVQKRGLFMAYKLIFGLKIIAPSNHGVAEAEFVIRSGKPAIPRLPAGRAL